MQKQILPYRLILLFFIVVIVFYQTAWQDGTRAALAAPTTSLRMPYLSARFWQNLLHPDNVYSCPETTGSLLPASCPAPASVLAASNSNSITFSDAAPSSDGGMHFLPLLLRLPPPPPLQIDMLWLETQITAMNVQGDRAYLSEGARLVILDVSNPADIIVIARSAPLPQAASQIVVRGDVVYWLDDEGLRTIDVSDPDDMIVMDVYPLPDSYTTALSVVETVVYLGNDDGLHILDASDPADLGLLSTYELFFGVEDMVVVNNLAHIVDAFDMYLIDVSQPTAPILVGEYTQILFPEVVEASNGVAYVADSQSLHVIDVHIPSSPVLLSTYPLSFANDIAVAGDVLYVHDGYTLSLLDISNPAALALQGELDTVYLDGKLQVIEQRVYIPNERAIEVIDVANPSLPTLIGQYDEPWSGEAVAVAGSYAYVAAGEDGLLVIDLLQPAVVGRYDTVGYAQAVVVVSDFAYLADGSGDFQIFDITNPADPLLVGSHGISGSVEDVAVQGNVAYVGSDNFWSGGLYAFDVTYPEAAEQIGSLSLDDGYGVAVAGNRAYVTNGYNFGSFSDGSLYQVDVTNPAQMVLQQTFHVDGFADNVAADAGIVYVLDGGMLYIYDMNGSGGQIAEYNPPGSAYDVVVAAGRAYIAGSQLTVLDVSIPATPVLVNSLILPDYASGVAVTDEHVFLTGDLGLYVLGLPLE